MANDAGRTSARPLPNDLPVATAAVIVPAAYAIVIAALSVSFVIIRLILIAARRCRIRARRLTLQTAADVVAADPRAPVLFRARSRKSASR